jgi:hypothetical protein
MAWRAVTLSSLQHKPVIPDSIDRLQRLQQRCGNLVRQSDQTILRHVRIARPMGREVQPLHVVENPIYFLK